MSRIYYPSLREFWPAVRARNFVKLLGQKPGNYAKNLAILAAKACVAPDQMWRVNPLTFAEREIGRDGRWETFHKDRLVRILGKGTYAHLEKERWDRYGSASMAYHNRGSAPAPAPAPLATKPFVWTAADELQLQAQLAQMRADAWARASAAAVRGKWGAQPEAEAAAAAAKEANVKMAAAAAAKEVKMAKRSWWGGPWVCGMIAVEKY